MPLQIDAVQHACQSVARQVRDHDRTIHLNFLVHHDGQRLETLSMAGQELLTHPAGEAAIRLLKTPQSNEQSAFLGLGVWREAMFGGLTSRDNILALITLNMDETDSMRAIRAQAWHLTWFALNMARLRRDPSRAMDFRGGILLPDPDDENDPSWNMRADVFSAIMGGINGDRDTIRELAYDRSIASLQRRAGHKPENYPFALSMEATQYAFAEMMRRPPVKKKQIETAMKIADEVGVTYDEASLKQWIYFCKPAQDMAWRSEPRDMILSAAINTSHDTFIRATGFLVSEITRIKPASIHNIADNYSPFAEDKYNQRLHERMVDKVFHDAIETSLQNNDGHIFMDVANKQNGELSDGHIAGWCASALQAAGRAFDSAIASGNKDPDEAARVEFEGNRHRTTWESLRAIGENIMEQYRQGRAVTFSDIIDFCGDTPAFAGVSNAVAYTMKDPAYVRKLQVANDLNTMPDMKPQGPSAPALGPRAPAGPAGPSIGLPGFNLGGGGSARVTRPPPVHSDDETTTSQ